jgi:hypothetical protein
MNGESPTLAAAQMMLFEAVQTANGDGSFTVRPKAVAVVREIGAERAGKILGLHVKTIHRLCELGEEHGGLKAYKLPAKRGNAKWRIDWQSTVTYKARREAQMRGGRVG